MDYLRILGTENTAGGKHLATRVEGAPYSPGRTPCVVGPRWPSSTYPFTHTLLLPPTNTNNQLKPESKLVLLPFFDLLAQSTSHKTAWGDCSLVCDSSIGPISFCSNALFIANFCCLGDPVLELACQIYMVKSSFDA